MGGWEGTERGREKFGGGGEWRMLSVYSPDNRDNTPHWSVKEWLHWRKYLNGKNPTHSHTDQIFHTSPLCSPLKVA